MSPKGYVAIVGSREVPLDELELLIRIGRTFTDLGYAVSSGDAYGSDRAGWWGARQSRNYATVGARIYLVESRTNRNRCALDSNFLIAQDYPEQWTMAEALALKARGSWGGINGPNDQYKRDLHIRNVFQILGHDLETLVKTTVYYAAPVGPVANEKVSGGTNTAVRLSVEYDVANRVNLHTDDGLKWAERFLAQYEEDYPYVEIDWRELLHPKDQRLAYLT